MKNVTLKTLTLKDWRTWNREIAFNGQRTQISGKNRSGKSNVLDSILWLLTGSDSEDRSNYMLFDTRVEYTKENSPTSSVEATITIDDYDVTLRKEARIGWVRPKGQENYERKNTDDYKFFIDNVEVSATDYKQFIEGNLCPIDKLKYIMNIMYYENVEWKELREDLASIIGKVSSDEYEGDFSEIMSLVKKFGSVENARKIVSEKHKPLVKALGKGDTKGEKVVEKETLQRQIEEMGETIDLNSIDVKISELNNEIRKIDNELVSDISGVAPYIEKRNKELNEISELEKKMENYLLSVERKNNEAEFEITNAIKIIESYNRQAEEENRHRELLREKYNENIKSEKENFKRLTEKRTMLLKEANEIKMMVFDGDTCKYCGQKLPKDEVDKQYKLFEEEKEKRYNELISIGRSNNEAIKASDDSIKRFEFELNKIAKDVPLKPKDELLRKLDEAKRSRIIGERTEEYVCMKQTLEYLRNNLTEIPISSGNDDIKIKKESINDEIRKLIAERSVAEMKQSLIDKSMVLESELKEMASKRAECERTLDMFDEMERQKAEIVKKRIKERFRLCDVQMEEKKKDGTIVPSCKITLRDVPIQVNNSAGRMIAGIDLSDAFCKYYGINMPLIVDNFERMDSTNQLIDTERQLITMKVSDNDFAVM